MHHRCNYPDQSGYTLVEVVQGLCEVGEGCDGRKMGCPYAWREKDQATTRQANKAFNEFAKRLESRI